VAEPPGLVAQIPDERGDGQLPVVPQPRRGDPHGQRDEAAQLRELERGRVLGRDPLGPGDLDQQRDRLRGAERGERAEVRVVQAHHPVPAGDQHQAAGGAGQQRLHLGRVRRVVQHDQHPASGEPGAVERGPLVRVGRDRLRGHAERAQQVVQRLLGGQRGRVRRVAAQVDEQLAVREQAADPVPGAHGQRGLADPAHAAQGRDHHHPGVRALARRPGEPDQLLELGGRGR
jgi:hypothetical protein